MKTCEERLFGISIDELVLFKASLVVLCFLSLLLVLISILIVWLRKIQRQIVGSTKNTRSLPLVSPRAANFEGKNSWKNLEDSTVYGASSSDRNGTGSNLQQETSFDNFLAPGNDEKSATQEEFIARDKNDATNVQNVDSAFSAPYYLARNDYEQNVKGGKLKKDYMSLKGAKDHMYAKLEADDESTQLESKMGCDERQNGDDSNEDDHGYLVVIHSDKSPALSEGTGNEKPPPEDESLYLIPFESKMEEDGHNKMEGKIGTEFGMSKGNGASNVDDRAPPFKDLEEGKYEYLSSQHVGKLSTFGHNAEIQQTQLGVSKDADEDDSGYLIVQHVGDGADGKAGTDIPVSQFQAGVSSENDESAVNPRHGDDNSYDYIQTKYWTEPADNNDSTKDKPVTNLSTEDSLGYLTVIHETEVNSSKEQEYSTDQIYSIIHDGNNNTNVGVQSEVVYVNQNGAQNPGAECPDDVPLYANNDAQQQSSMCNDNVAFSNVDESPLYDNP